MTTMRVSGVGDGVVRRAVSSACKPVSFGAKADSGSDWLGGGREGVFGG